MAQIKDKVGHFFAWALKGKEPVSVDVTRRDEAEANTETSKEVSIQQLKQGYGEVVETMKSVRSHLEQQAQRSEQMLQLLGNLPEVLKSIPENARTQAGMLEAIHAHLDNQNQTSKQLTDAITSLATASNHQQRALTAIDSHLAEDHESRAQLNQGVTVLNETLGQVKESNAATRASMGAVVEQARVNDERMRNMYQRSQKMNTMMVLLCLALATGALALGGYMAVLVSKVVNAPAAMPVQSSAVAPPATTSPADPASPASQTTPDSEVPAFSSNAYRVDPAAAETTPQNDEVGLDRMGPPALQE